jgi:hypothetical protein
MSVRSGILERVIIIAGPRNKSPGPLVDDLQLSGSDLDPLCIVAHLDDELGLASLSTDERVAGQATPGDFARFHNKAAG